MPKKNHAVTINHCLVIYPFLGIEIGSAAHGLFVRLIEQCNKSCPDAPPIVVHNQRSRKQEDASRIFKELRGSIEIIKNWGADTCQDWLDGFGYVLSQKINAIPTSSHRIVLLPGDLVEVAGKPHIFFNQLDEFIRYQGKPFLVGDFDSVDPLSEKELIDTYGIYPLVANWFPGAWQAIRALKIRKPRSEFLNIAVPTLQTLLRRRVFAYEQTLNMLIVQWDSHWQAAQQDVRKADPKWDADVGRMYLGKLSDDSTSRNFRGATDQIERAERLLRSLWRELHGWNLPQPPEVFRELAEKYERLDEHSTRIRDAARIAIWAQIDT